MTGEAEAQDRTVINEHESPLEASNLIFNGTLAVNGVLFSDRLELILEQAKDTALSFERVITPSLVKLRP